MELPTEIQERILLSVDCIYWIDLSEVCSIWNSLLYRQVSSKLELHTGHMLFIPSSVLRLLGSGKFELLRKGDLFTLARTEQKVLGMPRELEALAQSRNLAGMKQFITTFKFEWEPFLRWVVAEGHFDIIKYWFNYRSSKIKISDCPEHYGLGGRTEFHLTEKRIIAAQQLIKGEARYWWHVLIDSKY